MVSPERNLAISSACSQDELVRRMRDALRWYFVMAIAIAIVIVGIRIEIGIGIGIGIIILVGDLDARKGEALDRVFVVVERA